MFFRATDAATVFFNHPVGGKLMIYLFALFRLSASSFLRKKEPKALGESKNLRANSPVELAFGF